MTQIKYENIALGDGFLYYITDPIVLPLCPQLQICVASSCTHREFYQANIVHIGSASLQTSAEFRDPVWK